MKLFFTIVAANITAAIIIAVVAFTIVMTWHLYVG
jgi:hypothetical protein